MTPYHVGVHHNAAARFVPYRPEDPLTRVFTFARDMPDGVVAAYIADWTFRMCNADLEVLEHDRVASDAELAFPLACLYRLLRLRSLSAAVVVSVRAQGHTTWLACALVGWQRITTLAHISGWALTTNTPHQHRGHNV